MKAKERQNEKEIEIEKNEREYEGLGCKRDKEDRKQLMNFKTQQKIIK